MKLPVFGTIIILVLFSGCATTSTHNMPAEELASGFGVETSDARYFGKLKFVEIPEGKSEEVRFSEGVAVLTNANLFLIEGGLEHSTSETELHIPIAEMGGVGICSRKASKTHQLQIKQEGRLIVLHASEGKHGLDNESIQKLYNTILADGVPAWTSSVYYVEDPSTGEVVQAVAVEVVSQAIGHAVMEGILHLLFFGL